MSYKSKKDEHNYNRRYYKKHRLDLLEKKRKRYEEDEEYREAIKERSLRRYHEELEGSK